MNLIIENVMLVLILCLIVAAWYIYFYYIKKEISASEYDELKDWVIKYPDLIKSENLKRISQADYFFIKMEYKHYQHHEREKIREMKKNPDLVNSRKQFLDSINKD